MMSEGRQPKRSFLERRFWWRRYQMRAHLPRVLMRSTLAALEERLVYTQGRVHDTSAQAASRSEDSIDLLCILLRRRVTVMVSVASVMMRRDGDTVTPTQQFWRRCNRIEAGATKHATGPFVSGRALKPVTMRHRPSRRATLRRALAACTLAAKLGAALTPLIQLLIVGCRLVQFVDGVLPCDLSRICLARSWAGHVVTQDQTFVRQDVLQLAHMFLRPCLPCDFGRFEVMKPCRQACVLVCELA